MSAAESLLYWAQRLVWALWPTALAVTAVALLAQGRFESAATAGWQGLAVVAGLVAAIVVRASERWRTRFRRRKPRQHRIELEIGLALLCLCEVLLQATGGARSLFEPALYLVVALLVFFHRRAVGLSLGIGALCLDAGLAMARGELALPAQWTRLAFMAVFAGLALGLLSMDALRRRKDHSRRINDEIRALHEDARDYRMIGAALGPESRSRPPREEAEKRVQAAVCAMRESVLHILEMVHCAMRPHTAILLWLDAEGKELKIKEVISESDRLEERPLRAGEGVLGGILKRLAPVNLINLRDSSRFTYYSGPENVRFFLGVPVLENGIPRGILAVDRTDDRAFDETDELLLGHAAREVMRALENERILAHVDSAKQVQERFYRASESFREALTFEDVYRVTCQAACEIAAWDLAAVTLQSADEHHIAKVFGDADPKLEGQRIDDGVSLCSMAAKNRHELPLHGESPGRDVAVFSPKVRLKGYESLLVLPLIARAESLGTLVLAAHRRGAFPQEAREMLRVIANQAAGALEHAQAYARLETLATTDGLTGLVNHRNFQERMDELLARADRHEKKAVFILCDIDHFKSINDTYGHPVGDMVLREVAQVLGRSARKVDIVARYGGEEFALVLEGTDEAGGLQLAERIRSDIAARVFRCEQGTFRVTISLGVAVYPADAPEKHALIERADQALYAAKRGGRNRTVRATPARAPRAEGARG